MSEQLYIRLGTKIEHTVSWMVWSDSENEVIASGELANAEQLISLQQRAGGRSATIFVPSSAISFKLVDMPSKINRQVLQALPYMLEEELAADVDELFFASGSKYSKPDGETGQQLEVAVVEQSLMQQWLDWLEAADISCKLIVPDCLALPWQNNEISIIKLGQDWLIRGGSFTGIICSDNQLSFWLSECVTQLNPKNEAEQSEAIVIRHYSPLPEQFSLLESDIDGALIKFEPAEYNLPMEVMAKASANAAINLRQKQFQFKKDSSQFVKIWRNVAIVAGVALLVNLVDKGISIHQINAQTETIERQVRQAYVDVFPNGKNLSLALIKRELKRKTAGSDNSSEQTRFLVLLSASQTAFAAVPDLKPDSIRFDSKRGELRVNASAKNFQSFELFKSTANKANLIVDQGSLNNKGNEVVGALTIRNAS